MAGILYLCWQSVSEFRRIYRGSSATSFLRRFARLYRNSRNNAVPDKIIIHSLLYHLDEIVSMNGSIVIQAGSDVATRGFYDNLRTAYGIALIVGTGTCKESHKGKSKGEE
jgi:hypothetical protein